VQVILLHDAGKRGSSLATAIMEHAGSLVSLAGAYYCSQRYEDAADAYSKSLAVFEMIDDTDKVVKCLINLANLYELQVRAAAAARDR
jgi:tetratricopeptide (TPR) repeat protein